MNYSLTKATLFSYKFNILHLNKKLKFNKFQLYVIQIKYLKI